MKKAELLAEQARLHALANELARKHWGVDYTGTLRLTRRNWRCQNAAFAFNNQTGLREIRMSLPVNTRLSAQDVTANLLHELVHWRLLTLGLPCSDEDGEFIAECLRVGAPISGAASAVRAYEGYIKRQKESEAAA